MGVLYTDGSAEIKDHITGLVSRKQLRDLISDDDSLTVDPSCIFDIVVGCVLYLPEYNGLPAIHNYFFATIPKYIALSWVAKAQPIGQVELFRSCLALSTWSSELATFSFSIVSTIRRL